MNSWSSSSLSACAPPLITFSIGVGSTCAFGPPRYRYSGSPALSAAALRHGERDAEDRVRAERRLVRGAVEVEQQRGRRRAGRGRRCPRSRRRSGRRRSRPPASTPLPPKRAGIAVAQLDAPRARRSRRRSAPPPGRTRRRRARTSTSTVGLPAGIEDLAGVDELDARHRCSMVPEGRVAARSHRQAAAERSAFVNCQDVRATRTRASRRAAWASRRRRRPATPGRRRPRARLRRPPSTTARPAPRLRQASSVFDVLHLRRTRVQVQLAVRRRSRRRARPRRTARRPASAATVR